MKALLLSLCSAIYVSGLAQEKVHPIHLVIKQSKDEESARRLLAWAASHDTKDLEASCKASENGVERIFAGYLLFKLDPTGNRELFVRSFPQSDHDLNAFIENGVDPDGITISGVPWRLGFWPVYDEYFEKCVLTDDQEALKRWFRIVGKGDGSTGETICAGASDLFSNHPQLVLRNWDVARPYLRYLGDLCDGPGEAEQIYRRYRMLMKPGDPRLVLIKNQLSKIVRAPIGS